MIAVMLSSSLAACSARTQPAGPRAPTAVEDVPVMGHVARVHLDQRGAPIVGELVSATPEGVWIRTGSRAIAQSVGPKRVRGVDDLERHVFIPSEKMRRITVHRYEARRAIIATGIWGGAAMGLAASHGLLFIFTLPTAAALGGIATLATYLQSIVIVGRPSPRRVAELRRFARFPAGAPAGWPSDLRPSGAAAETPFEPHEDPTPRAEPPAHRPTPPTRCETIPAGEAAGNAPDDPRAYHGPLGVRCLDAG